MNYTKLISVVEKHLLEQFPRSPEHVFLREKIDTAIMNMIKKGKLRLWGGWVSIQ